MRKLIREALYPLFSIPNKFNLHFPPTIHGREYNYFNFLIINLIYEND